MSRCFIADPVCVFDFGHNPQQLIYYKKYFEKRGFETIALCGHPFSKNQARKFDFTPSFLYYYDDFMPLEDSTWLGDDLMERTSETLKTMTELPEHLVASDELEALAMADWIQIIERFEISEDDYIFCPSVDFYGMMGLLKALELKFPDQTPPHLCFRFIGVMENATASFSEPLRPLRVFLRQPRYKGRLKVTAESPVYCRYLSKFFGFTVDMSLYPLRATPLPLGRGEPFVVLSAGSGREDKGFFRLLEIARRYATLYPEDDVLFVAQSVRAREEEAHPYEIAQMIAAPNMKLLPAVLPSAEIERQYAESHILIAPYDFETYRCRGSAVTQEGISKGRPVLITAHTGFHDLAAMLPTLHNCASDDDFCDHIHRYYVMDRGEIEKRAAESAAQYELRSFSSIDDTFKATPSTSALAEDRVVVSGRFDKRAPVAANGGETTARSAPPAVSLTKVAGDRSARTVFLSALAEDEQG